jgi:broad specificity phosphatase PhoE
MQRAWETAQPLAIATRLPVDVVSDWAEADRTTDRYRSTETLRAQSAEEWQRFLANPIHYLGADPEKFRDDVLRALNSALTLPVDSRVAIFTHGMVINTVLSHLLGLQSLVHFSPGYGSLTRLGARSASQVGVVSINELGHQNLTI